MTNKSDGNLPLDSTPMEEQSTKTDKPHNIKIIILFSILIILPIWYFMGKIIAMMFNITIYKHSIVNVIIEIILGMIFTMTPLLICALVYYFCYIRRYKINLGKSVV